MSWLLASNREVTEGVGQGDPTPSTLSDSGKLTGHCQASTDDYPKNGGQEVV